MSSGTIAKRSTGELYGKTAEKLDYLFCLALKRYANVSNKKKEKGMNLSYYSKCALQPMENGREIIYGSFWNMSVMAF